MDERKKRVLQAIIEEYINTAEPVSSNTTNPVEMILVGMDNAKLVNGSMADIAPTMLDILEISKPEEMTGKTLLRRE